MEKIRLCENPFKTAFACKHMTPQTSFVFNNSQASRKKGESNQDFELILDTRFKTIRFDFEFQDIQCNKGYHILEYQNPAPNLREYSELQELIPFCIILKKEIKFVFI
jgi:hypothetical protein